MNENNEFNKLLQQVHSCALCRDELPGPPRPVLQVHPDARILIAGQAPGARVHASGIPFDDASGERLREWMGVDRETFYNARDIAILPMGFCYPGKGKSGDLPPIPRCAQQWRKALLASMPNIALTLVIGKYAIDWHIPDAEKNLTATVKAWRNYPGALVPLPHPSPRNNIWLSKNPWFAEQLLPELRLRVRSALRQ